MADLEDQGDPRERTRRLRLPAGAGRARLGQDIRRLAQTDAAAHAPGRDLGAGEGQEGPHHDPGARACRVADDLVERKFRPDAPNVLWVADITYLRTWEGWLYLAAVQDAYSRRIVGWAMTEHMRTELVTDALQMAVARRRPEPGLIHHSDQGSQYVALGFGQQARDAGIAVSMGSKGDAYDNAVAESFFATIKKELVHRHSWPSRRDLSSAVFDYIEAFYNRQRRHSTLGYLSPEEYEREQSQPTNND